MQNPENLKNRDPFWQLLNPLEKSRVQKIHQIRPEIGKANYPLKTDRAVSSFLFHQSSKKNTREIGASQIFSRGLNPSDFSKIKKRASNFKNLPFARFQLFGWMIPFSCAKSMSWALALSARNASILLIIFPLLSGFLLAPLFVLRVRGSLEQLESGNWLAEKAENGWAVFCFEFFGAPI